MLRFCRTWFKASILRQRVFDLVHGPGWVAVVVVVVVVVLVVVVVFTLENRLFQSPKKKPSYSNPINFSGANLRKLISFATGIRSGLREAESPG